MLTEMDVGDSAAMAARTLGYETLKDLQRSVIVSFINGNDIFAVLPTGYGKSLCFACLPLVFDILFHPQEASIIVVTPLTAIMEGQVIFSIILL